MMAFKEKYKASKPWKKVLVFNTYSLVLALIFFVLSYLVDVCSSLIYGETNSFTLLSGLISALGWGYIMCFLTLSTGLIKETKREELKDSSEIKDTETK